MMRGVKGFLLVAGILLFAAGSAYAQGMGTIFGKVTDSTGGVMPGVTVTITSPAMQGAQTAVTGGTGTYQFPTVPTGTYTVTFELDGFKKAVRNNIQIPTGFSAQVDQKMEVGNKTEEVTVSAAPPVVDTKKIGTGATFTKDILENIPSARDPWQIVNMTPGVQLSGINVGGSASGQQLTPSSRGTSSSVQWNLEGGNITDLSSNSSPSYFNFDSFEQIQVVNGGGDVSVQSSGLAINLVTKSGSNVFKGSAVGTFENSSMQSQNVTRELFNSGSNGFLSGNPLKKILVTSAEYGGPIKKNRLWFWAAWDRQDINVGVINFFDASAGGFCSDLVAAQKAGSTTLRNTVTYEKLNDVAKCLKNDKTLIKDLQWKFNYQLNSSNKFQYLFQSDDKYRNARGSNATTQIEASTQQTSDRPKGSGYWGLPLPTHSLTHTLIASDKLVFNNMFTYVGGGFYLDYQDVPPQGSCAQTKYLNTTDASKYNRPATCLYNIQGRANRTTGVIDRSLGSSASNVSSAGTYQTLRPSWELKTDATYFVTNKLGGDHSLKFGLGWRKNPIQTFTHYSGGARGLVQCANNSSTQCGDGTAVAPGSGPGIVPYFAVVYRDLLLNNDWHTYNGYVQDSYSRGKLRVNGGVRYDWQTSKWLGGCVAPNVLRPDLLPGFCEGATDVDPVSHEKIQAFSNFAPRLSVTYDLFGNGKTSVHANYAYYFQTKITLANALGGLDDGSYYMWGTNASSGACLTTAGSSCWTDANRDTVVQVNELTGTPSISTTRLNPDGSITGSGNLVDKSAKLARTREFVAGVQHELIANLAVGVDYIYRKYDQGTRSFSVGYSPLDGVSLASIYESTPHTYTDPVTGLSANYYLVQQGAVNPSGLGSITLTDPGYSVYNGVDITMNKRFSNKWQANAAVTLQTNPNYQPPFTYTNPTGLDLTDGRSTIARYLIKFQGSYQAPWQVMVSANLQINDGAARTISINGPGSGLYGGVRQNGAATTISYSTLQVEPSGTTRLKPTDLLDLGAQKVMSFQGGKYRLKLMLDCFNVFNVNTITGFSSNNRSTTNFTAPSGLVAPRIFRIGASVNF